MNNTHKRGFASLSAERRSEIASLGGKAAHAKGNAHQFTSEEARAAGKKGGKGRKSA
jgi:general stress protein YciG